jgi:hypothetical protein
VVDTEVKESRERVRAALQQSGFAFPHNKRITVNLAPAERPRSRAASTCRSRSGCWPPTVSSMPSACHVASSPAN